MGQFDKNQSDASKKDQRLDDVKASKSSKDSLSHKAGDMLEKGGQKLKDAGADKLGNAIYKAGNKLEHSQDKKKTNH